MAEAKTGTIDDKVKEPSLTEKANTEMGKTFPYRDEISDYLAGLRKVDAKGLEKDGILKEGKINALVFYEALNRVAKDLIRTHFGDSEDYNWRPEWEQFKALVERFGQQGKLSKDLLDQIAALYVTAAQNYAAQRNIGRTRGAPLAEAKAHTNEMAGFVGKEDIYGFLIAKAQDPTAVVQIKSQIEPDFRNKIAEQYAVTGNYQLKKVA